MGDILGGSLRTDSSGRTTLTGAGSDIDFQSTIDKIIEAKRQPAVRLENRIAENQTKVDAMTELQSRIRALEEAADQLRGRPTFDNSSDVFEAKEGFLTATRTDGAAASPATSIITANVENSATPQSHDLEVLETADVHRVAADSVSDASADLSAEAGIADGSDFLINGQTVTLDGTDSLQDLRAKINNANKGDNATGVSASVVNVSDTQSVLQLTSDDPGKTISLQDGTNAPLQQLGILDGAGNIQDSAELQKPSTSIFRADGLSDASVFDSNSVAGDETTALSAFGIANGDTLELDITNDNNVTTQTINVGLGAGDDVAAGDSISALADEISSRFGLRGRAVVENGQVRLEVNAENTEDVQQSRSLSDSTVDLSTFDTISPDAATLRFTTEGGPTSGEQTTTLNFDPSAAGNDLDQLAADIDGLANVRARVDNGRLIVRSNDGGTESDGKLSITDVSGSLARDLDLGSTDNVSELSVTSNLSGDGALSQANAVSRVTNTVEDLFAGTTLNLFKAERGTNLQFDIERDQDAVNTSLQDFVKAFNGVKQFINAQQQNVALEGQDPKAEGSIVGALQGESVLRDAEQDINRLLSTGASNVSTKFEVLGQVGINFVDNNNLSDPTKEDTLEINQKELNDKLLNDFTELRNLFRFNFTSSNTGLTLLGSSEETGAADGLLKVEVDGNGDVDDTGTLEVDVGGTLFAVAETSDNVLEVQDGPLAGLTLRADLSGPAGVKTIDISTSTGIGHETFHTADRLGNDKANDGIIQSEIDRLIGRDNVELTGQNERFEAEIERIETSLDRERERLLRQFTAMERSLIELESAQKRLEQFASAGSGNN